MRRRLPGLWGRVGGIVAVDANRFWQRIIKSPSAETDAASQSIPVLPGKGKGGQVTLERAKRIGSSQPAKNFFWGGVKAGLMNRWLAAGPDEEMEVDAGEWTQ